MQKSIAGFGWKWFYRKTVSIILCTIVALSIVMQWLCLYACAENMGYLYDATGNGWVCLRAEETMDIDYDTGIYPDGTKVVLLESRQNERWDQESYLVRNGRAEGWVFADEILNEEEWQHQQQLGEFIPFNSHWQLVDNLPNVKNIYSFTGYSRSQEVLGPVTESHFFCLGLYNMYIHIQLSNMDGFFPSVFCEAPQVENSEFIDAFHYEYTIWIDVLQKALHMRKGDNPSNWTEAELKMMTSAEVDENYTSPFERQITPSWCDITQLEAIEIAVGALINDGWVTEEEQTQLTLLDAILFYGSDDVFKHIWFIRFLWEPRPGVDFAIDVDAHTKDVLHIV